MKPTNLDFDPAVSPRYPGAFFLFCPFFFWGNIRLQAWFQLVGGAMRFA